MYFDEDLDAALGETVLPDVEDGVGVVVLPVLEENNSVGVLQRAKEEKQESVIDFRGQARIARAHAIFVGSTTDRKHSISIQKERTMDSQV